MRTRGLQAYLIPSSDEHLNEYVPLWGARREFCSGFSGSAGDLLVLPDKAFLYTDSRYHLQAEKELEGTDIDLMAVGQPGVPHLRAHLKELGRDCDGLKLGLDPMVVSVSMATQLESALASSGGCVEFVSANLVDGVWKDRPTPPTTPLRMIPIEWAGTTPQQKVSRVREELTKAGAQNLVTVKLDQVAWLLNLRSSDDVPFNPVFECYLAIEPDATHLFIRDPSSRVPSSLRQNLPELELHEYEAMPDVLRRLQGVTLVDTGDVTAGVVALLRETQSSTKEGSSPLEALKARKNVQEADAMRRANLHASVAKTKALLWLRRQLDAGETVTEASFRDHLEALYAQLPDFNGLSFRTIAATGPNGAIIHYGDCDDTPLEEGHLFLIDSGAHIGGGTTDDTRTVAVGATSDDQQRAYTLVLKGHIHAAWQRIPLGTAGHVLDTIARAPLWNAGLHYDHGTGHGVGAYLCVHEGPFGLSQRKRGSSSSYPLATGMVTSVEPGYYKPEWGGIRLEGLYLFEESTPGDGDRPWLQLEPLTFIPHDPTLIDRNLLGKSECAWLDAYHRRCQERLEAHLTQDERTELAELLNSSPLEPGSTHSP